MKNTTKKSSKKRTGTSRFTGAPFNDRVAGFVTVMIDGAEHRLDKSQAEELGLIRKIERYSLTVTSDEAAVLDAILSRIGGPMEGPRGLVDSLLIKLRELADTDSPHHSVAGADQVGMLIDRNYDSPGCIYFTK